MVGAMHARMGVASRRQRHASLLHAAGLLAAVCSTSFVMWLPGHGDVGARSWQSSRQLKVALSATADTFDPWSVLGISPEADQAEARKAYKKLIAKYHPDVDPSPEAEAKFQKIVRAHAVVTGEDKELDTTTLLSNAVENIRNDMEFKKAQVAQLKEEARQAEEDIKTMEASLKTAEVKRDQVSSELGLFGGGALGLLVAGPTGFVVGAILGLTLSKRDDSVGQVIRGTGTVAKGAINAVGQAVNNAQN
mmetsp:Transcript_91170/g.162328  ORF Transcript_91170/g.162328 Transcript_91170/m.162328 type:complete len:249 (+) Transcript_91170:58-804(+)